MSYETLFANQVEEFLLQSPVVLDHRDPRSHSDGHLPGALLASEANITSLVRSRDYQKPVLIYCYHGNSSRDLCQFVMQFGFKKVYNLDGGWQAWSNYASQLKVPLSVELESWRNGQGFDPNNLNARVENGMTSLMLACLQGKASLVTELVAAGVDINLVNDDRNSALWFACVSENCQIIKLLLENGIDIDNQNVNGATALIYAASASKIEAVKLLTEYDADLDITTDDGFSALESAASAPVLTHLRMCSRQKAS